MKYYLVIFILVTGINLRAQIYHPFPTKNAMWTEMYYGLYPDYEVVFHSYALKDKDTTINGKVYHKLYHSIDTMFTEDELCGGLREDNKRVYYYSIQPIELRFTNIEADTEVLLYDFSLELLDTITEDTFRISHPEFLVVLSIESITIGTEYRNRFTFGIDTVFHTDFISWIESIGYERGLLFATGDIPTNGLWNDLICFKQDNKVLYHHEDYANCYYVINNAIEDQQENLHLKIFPNPVQLSSNFRISGQEIDKILVIDLLGDVVKEFSVNGKPSIEINSGDLTKGLYILLAINKKGDYQTSKFVID